MLWSALTDPATGYFRPDDVEVLFDGTREDVANTVERFFGEAGGGDTLLFYYSGHGRRTGGDLMLCCRDTVTSRPHTSGLMSDMLNKLIKGSSAKAIAVILDCCYSGAFKGQPAIEDEFAGEGRFVIAAASAFEEAADASEAGAASPFTAALVAGLNGAAAGGGGQLTLEDLSRYLEGPSAGLTPRPRKNFDGTGSVAIARIPGAAEAPIPEGSTRAPELQPTPSQSAASGGPDPEAPAGWGMGSLSARGKPRSRNDLSVGDLRSYRVYLPLSAAIIAAGLVSAASLNTEYHNSYGEAGFDGISPVCVAAVIAGTAMLVVSVAQWLVTRRVLSDASSRRALLTTYSTGIIQAVQLARDICAIGAASVVAYGFTSQYADDSFVVLIALLAVPGLASAAGRLCFGDAAYAAGTILVLSALFFPISAAGSSMLIGDNGIGLLQLACGIAMAYCWLVRLPALYMGLAALSCAVPATPLLANAWETAMAPIVAMVGACTCIVAVLSGDGIQVEADGLIPEYPGIWRRLTARRSRSNLSEVSG